MPTHLVSSTGASFSTLWDRASGLGRPCATSHSGLSWAMARVPLPGPAVAARQEKTQRHIRYGAPQNEAQPDCPSRAPVLGCCSPHQPPAATRSPRQRTNSMVSRIKKCIFLLSTRPARVKEKCTKAKRKNLVRLPAGRRPRLSPRGQRFILWQRPHCRGGAQ